MKNKNTGVVIFPGLGRLPPCHFTSCHSSLPGPVCPRAAEQLLLRWMPSMRVVRAVSAQRAENTGRQKMREKIWEDLRASEVSKRTRSTTWHPVFRK